MKWYLCKRCETRDCTHGPKLLLDRTHDPRDSDILMQSQNRKKTGASWRDQTKQQQTIVNLYVPFTIVWEKKNKSQYQISACIILHPNASQGERINDLLLSGLIEAPNITRKIPPWLEDPAF